MAELEVITNTGAALMTRAATGRNIAVAEKWFPNDIRRSGRITRHSYKAGDTMQDAGSLRVGDDLPGAGTSACTARA
jgi:hypothetical protein